MLEPAAGPQLSPCMLQLFAGRAGEEERQALLWKRAWRLPARLLGHSARRSRGGSLLALPLPAALQQQPRQLGCGQRAYRRVARQAERRATEAYGQQQPPSWALVLLLSVVLHHRSKIVVRRRIFFVVIFSAVSPVAAGPHRRSQQPHGGRERRLGVATDSSPRGAGSAAGAVAPATLPSRKGAEEARKAKRDLASARQPGRRRESESGSGGSFEKTQLARSGVAHETRVTKESAVPSHSSTGGVDAPWQNRR